MSIGNFSKRIRSGSSARLPSESTDIERDRQIALPLRRRWTWPSLVLALVSVTSIVNGEGLISPQLSGAAQIAAVSRSPDKLDVFSTDVMGAVRTAAWEPGFSDWWHGWWMLNGWSSLNGARPAQGAPVAAVSRSRDKLDIFIVGGDGRVWTTAWELGLNGWPDWRPIPGVSVLPGSPVSAVSRSTDKLDIFVTDSNGFVQTAAWEPALGSKWHDWRPILGVKVPPGSPVSAVSRSTDKLDIFVTDVSGLIQTAAWEPAFGSVWHGWWWVNGGQAAAGSPVTAVSRSTDKLDLFVVPDGRVWTAAWEPGPLGWTGWRPIGNLQAPGGAPVKAVSRSADKLDIFVTDLRGHIQTAAWEPAFGSVWHGWWWIDGGVAAPGSPVGAVSRSTDKLDVFAVLQDGRAWTAAWEPDFKNGWSGWWPMGTPEPRSVRVCGTIEVHNKSFTGWPSQTFSTNLSLTPATPNAGAYWVHKTLHGCQWGANPWDDVSADLNVALTRNFDNSVSVQLSDSLDGFDLGPICASAAGQQTIQAGTTNLLLPPGQGQPFNAHLQNGDNGVWAAYHFTVFNDCAGCSTPVSCTH